MTWTAPQGIVTSSIEKLFHETRGADHDRYGKANTCTYDSRPIFTGHGLPALIRKDLSSDAPHCQTKIHAPKDWPFSGFTDDEPSTLSIMHVQGLMQAMVAFLPRNKLAAH
jgi:hypothetical protein